MSQTFNRTDHDALSTLFDPESRYPGYRPAVREAPNGDTKACPACGGDGQFGRSDSTLVPHDCMPCNGTGHVPNVDAEGVCDHDGVPAADCARCSGTGRTPAKRFLHVALKYKPPAWAEAYLARAHWEASKVAEALGVRKEYFPLPADGTLRVLEYPPGAGSAEHTDFDLFTVLLWRSTPNDLELLDDCRHHNDDARAINPHLHIGEIGELVGLGPATPHRVQGRSYVQKSIVYFAMPDHAAELPQPVTFLATETRQQVTVHKVGQWLAERIARSRY